MNRVFIVLAGVLLPALGHTQALRVVANTEEIQLIPDETFQLDAFVEDESGNRVTDAEMYYYTSKAKFAESDEDGLIRAYEPGQARIIVIGRVETSKTYARLDIPVFVVNAPPAKLKLADLSTEIYTGQSVSLDVTVVDQKGFEIRDMPVAYSSSKPAVAGVDPFGNVSGIKKGQVEITVTAGPISTTTSLDVRENPVTRIALHSAVLEARSGDVLPFKATAYDEKNKPVEGLKMTYSFQGVSQDPSNYASGLIRDDGRFVADVPGDYTIMCSFGGISAQRTVRIIPRDMTETVQLIGRGAISDVHTSDLWVWEGVDGRDYCVTGTWGGNGEAFFWDVTDPGNLILIDTITVDARTVNDVKVSEDGTLCVISREGASNRKNGIVLIDVTNPRDCKIISTFDDGLTGGVHNLFIYEDHVYALSNGERYDIINIEDRENPKKVGEFELDGPGHAIHDVWVEDGIAYSSNWSHGVFMVDVGNGVVGGSPGDPRVIGSYAYPSGWNHAAFPYKDKETGKFYVIAGDEAFPNGLHVDDNPTIPAGYLHFVDFTDIDNPEEVAKYEVPGAGSHNFWVDGDILYVANYNAGLRVVDLSGDLMGDLYKQGREIAWFLPTDPKGRVSNAPMTWGPQPHKGHVFFSDWNSGLWSVKVDVKKPEDTRIETR